jgi:hypothetical protein
MRVASSFNEAAVRRLTERLGPPEHAGRGEFAVWSRAGSERLWAWVAPGSRGCVVWWTRGGGVSRAAAVLMSLEEVDREADRFVVGAGLARAS